jgi:OmpA-OmpF porin, OOP family
MPSSNARRALAAAAVFSGATTAATPASAQEQAQGFAVERFYPSAPGGGWLVMDDLSMRGGLGGDVAVTSGYAKDPLRITDGVQHLAVVADQAFTDFGFAITYERFRLYLDLDIPVVVNGESGTVGRYSFLGPSVDVGSHPDTLSDSRLGFDARILGDPTSAFRLGAGAQVFVPNGNRSEYDSDGTPRAMIRALAAGDLGVFTYAAQLGIHIRPLDDSPTPGSPRGSELLFGAAAGARLPVGDRGSVVVVGPEIYGETALRSFASTDESGLEGLLGARWEGTADDGPQLRVKLGAGGGLNPHFGAPEWRVVFGVELFDHSGDGDKDGVTDSKDACPGTPGVKTNDPKTKGCPAAAN